jgi:alkanesulfonate monooxygenase SsuD/methylene tetrahydromethanopterin reductase-like flavin-dependent oxidoreductase (luciferase family)
VRATPPVRESIPIYAAAVQKGMARMAGDVADGMLGHPMCTGEWIERELIPAYEEGLRRSQRDRSGFEHIASVCCAIDDDEAAAIDAARRTIAFYATVKTYLPLYELHGFGAEAAAAGEAFRRGDIPGVLAAIPDAMVERYCAVGSADKVRARLDEVAELVDGIMPGPPTYFLPEETVAEYNRRILELVGDAK